MKIHLILILFLSWSYSTFTQTYKQSYWITFINPVDYIVRAPDMIYVEGNGTIDNFYIGETEIITAQYLAFCKDTKSHYPQWLDTGSQYHVETGTNTYYKDKGVSESAVSLPIVGVSWNDAVAYCEWLSKKTGQNYKLPTEIQWEYAAKGGKQSKGYKYAGSNDEWSVAWFDKNADSKPHNVKTKQKNELGIYDMSGNVWEWCQDLYSSTDRTRVLRGGGWFSVVADCRVAVRSYGSPNGPGSGVGFRVVRTK